MLINAEDGYLIFLNKRLVKHAIRADTEEGWIEIPDIAAVAPPNLTKKKVVAGKDPQPAPTQFPIKKIYGKVEVLVHPEAKNEG